MVALRDVCISCRSGQKLDKLNGIFLVFTVRANCDPGNVECLTKLIRGLLRNDVGKPGGRDVPFRIQKSSINVVVINQPKVNLARRYRLDNSHIGRKNVVSGVTHQAF